MTRLAGRGGRIYLALASGGVAEPVAFQASWSINFATNKIDVTAFGDANKVTVAGLPEATGQFAGFYDDASVQAYTAATDGLPRAFYLYTNTLTNLQYWFGQINPDMNIDATVADAIKVSSSWAAATQIKKQG